MHALVEWLSSVSPPWAQHLLALLTTRWALVSLGVVSVLSFVATVVGVPWFFARLPEDYFSRRELRQIGVEGAQHSRWYVLVRVGRNLLGLVLLLAGLVMLVLPGQGVLTLLVAVLLVDYPYKRRLQRWLLGTAPVWRMVDALRRRAGRPPLLRDAEGGGPG